MSLTIPPALLTRTDREIDAELFRLYSLLRRAPLHDVYGEPVADAIRAQIVVLRLRLTSEEAAERYEADDEFVQSEALNAADWLSDDGESPSAGLGASASNS